MISISERLQPELLARARRILNVSMALLIGLALAGPVSSVLADTLDPPIATIDGVVFQDDDGDGERDGSEPGVAGVTVSDGVNLVTTDDEGRYQLKIDVERRNTDIVFITQPAGYQVPTDESMTPLFYRDLGEVADGATATADFSLAPDPGSRNSTFSFANVADPHVNPQLPEQITEINSTAGGLGFIQVSGDLTNNATDAEFGRYKGATAESDLPVWPAVGNHEYYYGGDTDYASRIDNYRRHVGPEWYSFDYGNRHFIVLENNGQAPFEEQLDWARHDLEANVGDKELVVLTHQPMNVPFGSPSVYDEYGELLETYGAELVLVGHEHSNDVEPDSEWVPGAKHVQTSSSSYTIDNSPRGFRYVHMRGDDFENPFRMYGADQTLTITSPAPDARVSSAGTRTGLPEIQVNAYDTADEVVRVRYRLDGGSWRNLKPSGELTWHGRWVGRSPEPGEHTLDVEAIADGGATWTESSTFTLTDEPGEAPQAGADWNQHHGDAGHSGVAADELDPGLRLAWSYRTPGTFLTGSPVIVGGAARFGDEERGSGQARPSAGVIYAGTRDENGDGNAALHAVELATGKRLWEFPVPSSIVGSPAVADGTVFVPTLRGTLFAVDAQTGELRWQRDPEPGLEPFNQRAYSYYSPAVSDGKVYWAYQTRYGPASQGLLIALDTETGDPAWESPMTGATMSDGTPAVSGGHVFVGNQTADRVVAYDAATGERQWVSSNVLGGWQDGIPTAADGRVFIGSNNGIVARDAETGEDLWTYRSPHGSQVSSGSTPSAPAEHDGVVYMGFPSGGVTALDASTGAVLWDRVLPGSTYAGGVHSSPAVSGETLFVGANNGYLYALDRLTGQPLWEYEIGTWVASGPAISGNTLVTGAWDGNLYAFTPGGEAAERWARVTGTVIDAESGDPVADARVVADPDGDGNPVSTTTDDDGRYVLGLEAGTYAVSAAKRAYLPTDGSSSPVEVGTSGEHELDLELVEVTGPVAGSTDLPPDFGTASTRVDAVAGTTYHYALNTRVQATISGHAAPNNQPGTLAVGSIGDVALLDNTATETLDWTELILAETTNDPARPWGRDGEWLDITDIGTDDDAVVASGTAQVNPALETSLRYRALPDAPVVKVTLEVQNTGSEDFDGFFQYLMDPDSSDDTAYVPGVSGTNPGYVESGWSGNYVYVGPSGEVRSPAHAVGWVEDEPVGITAFGYIAGAWFDASVEAGETRTISWYHITDYPGSGHPTANVASWAAQLDLLDEEVANRSRAAGTVTAADTGEPAAGVAVEAIDGTGQAVASAWTGADGGYVLTLEPGTYTIRTSALGYAEATTTVDVTEGTTAEADLVLEPVSVAAGTGKTLTGGLVEAGTDDVVMENSMLAMAVSRVHDDPQLAGSTVGKPVDMAVRGRDDQIDWFNLPYVVTDRPEGTEAWQQTTVQTEDVEIVQASGEAAVVQVTGSSAAHPDLSVVTTYTIRPDEEWVTAETVFENTGAEALPVFVGDVIDHDGAGQHSGVAGTGAVTAPYSDPQAYDPTGPWIGMAGSDPQTYGLIYDGAGFTAYGNGNWIMSQFQVDIPAGDSHTLSRRIVAASNEGATSPFDVFEILAAG